MSAFNVGVQSGFSQAILEWNAYMHYDALHGYVHMMGKAAGQDSTWSHQYYRLRTGTWTTVSTSMWNNQGHIYGNFTIDTTTGDLYSTVGGADIPAGWDRARRARWWQFSQRASGVTAWATTLPSAFDFWSGGDNSIVSHQNGICYHPHLYGNNAGALILTNQFETIFIKKTSSTNPPPFVAHSADTYGNKEGIGCYWPAKNVAILGGDSHAALLQVAPNASTGGAPVLTQLPPAPIDVGGHSWSGNPEFGTIVVHPGNPLKLLCISSNTQRCWETTNGTTWTARANHPFTSAMVPRVMCSLHGMGIIWAVGINNANGQNFSHIWKPTP